VKSANMSKPPCAKPKPSGNSTVSSTISKPRATSSKHFCHKRLRRLRASPSPAGISPPTTLDGDFYDWDWMPDGRLIVVLGDVTGHGIGPALLAAACRAYARSSFEASKNLPAAITQINAAIARDLDPSRFITFAGVACTPGTGDLEILSAGHGPILLYSASHDAFIEIEAQGVPLGILPEYVSGPSTKIQLKKGDIFLLITDGFVEFENPMQEQFGKLRMKETVRASRALPPEKIIRSLYDAAVAHSNGTRQQDDLTAVLIKRD